jgi:hypothetical protein
MMRPAFHPLVGSGLVCPAVIIITLVMAIPAVAGVGLPPMLDANNTNSMEQYRIKVFYDAQKSEQKRLRVGQERYDRMLTNRAELLQAMANELAEREMAVAIPSESAVGNSVDNKEPNTLRGTLIGTAIIGLGFLGFRSYLNRQSLKDAARQN